ncbi:transcriptional regulator, TetR family [Actinomadura meyerae]|uniref:Transcriptional regulator, TetR family n=1 Tax=Actinomadura meyerae TaxID=240840 RepID=A0A239N660_9ACTN|nr:TetR family transcriptional regulator [Actinomadura meyerae]SNT49668.1 transcriptional regulator, TetR family [Actinomadura meyerae]
MSGGERAGLRERTRRAVRAELSALAVELFLERGYERTTVEDIATAAGMSRRSFFRYFPSKEDVVFGEAGDVAERVADAIRDRPGEEAPWACLRAVLREWQDAIHTVDLRTLRLIEEAPALRARLHAERDRMRELVSAALREHPGGVDAFTADLLTGAAAAALDAADREWLRSGGTADRAALLDRAFGVLSLPGEGRPGP